MSWRGKGAFVPLEVGAAPPAFSFKRRLVELGLKALTARGPYCHRLAVPLGCRLVWGDQQNARSGNRGAVRRIRRLRLEHSYTATVRGGGDEAQRDALTKANDYCAQQGRQFVPNNMGQSGNLANPYGPTGYAVTFNCLLPNDPAMQNISCNRRRTSY